MAQDGSDLATGAPGAVVLPRRTLILELHVQSDDVDTVKKHSFQLETKGATLFTVQANITKSAGPVSTATVKFSPLDPKLPYTLRIIDPQRKGGGYVLFADVPFEEIVTPRYTLQVSANNGTVAKYPDLETYDSGTCVELIPNASVGYRFLKWDGSCVGNANPLIVVMDSNKDVIAQFTEILYKITASGGAHGAIAPRGEITVAHGQNQTFSIVPNTGYHIEDVLVDGTSVGTAPTYTFSKVAGPHSIQAKFAVNK